MVSSEISVKPISSVTTTSPANQRGREIVLFVQLGTICTSILLIDPNSESSLVARVISG